MEALTSGGPVDLQEAFLFLAGGGVFVGLFSAALLVSRRHENTQSNRFLAGFLVLGSLNIAHPLTMQALWGHWNSGIRVLEPLQFLMAPVFARYIRSLFVPGRPFRLRSLGHVLPMVVVLILGQTPWLRSLDAESPLPLVTVALWAALLVQSAFYQVSSIRWLHRYRRTLPDKVSNTAGVDLEWLSWVFHFMFALYFLYVVLLVLMLHSPEFPPVRTILSLALTLLVGALSYRGLLQKKPPMLEPEEVEAPLVSETLKYERSALPDHEAKAVQKQLENLMDSQRPYLDPDLSLPSLAERLGLARNTLSYVINQRLGRNFYDFVNEYRVKEVKRLMEDPARRDHKLLAIAFDAGFNSKPAFNAVFRKMTGLTPSDYRRGLSLPGI